MKMSEYAYTHTNTHIHTYTYKWRIGHTNIKRIHIIFSNVMFKTSNIIRHKKTRKVKHLEYS